MVKQRLSYWLKNNLAKKKHPFLVDDGDARLVATREGVHIIGTIGALGKAFREGRVTKEEMAQYADIFESTRRRYSENELNSLRHPDSSAPSKDNAFSGVRHLERMDFVGVVGFLVPRYGGVARFFPRCCVFRQNCG